MDYKLHWENGVSFETYFENSLIKAKELDKSEDAHDIEYHNYYKLGIVRSQRLLKTFESSENQQALLKKKYNHQKFLIISEPWCGDSSQVLPAMHLFFNSQNIKIIYRDENEELMNLFLTNGTKSIPKVLILDEHFELKNTWGPRTQYANQILINHKYRAEGINKELFYREIQSYYAKNKGEDVINELVKLL